MKPNKNVMLLGGNLYSKPSIVSLKDAGYKITLVDGNPSAPSFSDADFRGDFDFRDVGKGIELAKEKNVKAVLPTHDRAVIPASIISNELGIKGSSIESAKIATSKLLMRQCWKSAGIFSPDFKTASTFGEFVEAVKAVGFPAICKPTGDVGGGSRGIMKIDASSNLEDVYNFATSFDDEPLLVETFYEGREHSVEMLLLEGECEVLAISDKIQTDPPYRVGKSLVYPSSVSDETINKIKEVAVKAVKAVGIKNGASHLEVISIGEDKVIPIEIGLRCGGGAIPHPVVTAVTGINQFVEYANILAGRIDKIPKADIKSSACWHFINGREGILSDVKGFKEASQMDGIISAGLAVKSGDRVEKLKTSSARLGYFVAVGKNNEEALRLAVKAEQAVKLIYQD